MDIKPKAVTNTYISGVGLREPTNATSRGEWCLGMDSVASERTLPGFVSLEFLKSRICLAFFYHVISFAYRRVGCFY